VSTERDDQPPVVSPLSPAEAPTLDARLRPIDDVPRAVGTDALPTQHAGPHSDLATWDDIDDSFDKILKKVVRVGPVELLDLGSELSGRFTITRVLGEGGMGTVFVARDATLGREVAIKVHHAAGGARRLRREAIAMARLAHPNVVTVFEVGDLAGRPFVVMEYIPGTTLRAWLQTPRSVREILDVLLAAGEGLAAAHDAGLVHRDIKPENVLIGADGRARVGDFGLARELDSKDSKDAGDSKDPSDPDPPREHASSEDLRTPVTQTGAVLGTPAYMSPEQFAGEPVDARADQFAFCVTAWEALWNQRPFVGSSFAQLHAAISLGTRRPPPAMPKVPARMRAALDRGLSVQPADRFPTMHALLDEMRPPRRRTRRWLVAGGALALAAVATIAGVRLTRGDDDACHDAGVAELAPMRRDLPMQLLRHGAARLFPQAMAAQGRYITGFLDHARAACAAGHAHEWAPDIVAKSRGCFAITARTAALTLANADPAKPMDTLRRMRRLPQEDPCRNQVYLAARPPFPTDPVQLDALIDANATLDVGFDHIASHDLPQLQRTYDKLLSSPARLDPEISAGMIILRAWQAFEAGKIADARKLFVDAYYAARAIDDEQISSVALGLLIQRGSDMGLEPPAVQEWLRTALADADRVRTRSPWLAGKIYLVAAQAADLGGDAKTALDEVARARSVLDRSSSDWIETYVVEGAVLMWSGRVDDGVKAYDTALAQKVANLGADDPEVAQLLSNYAASLLEVDRLDPALGAADRAAKIIANLADPGDDRIDPIRVNLGAVLIGANRNDEALALLTTARANNVKRFGELNTIVANIDSNLSTLYNDRGEHDRAIVALRSALAIEEKLLGPDHVEVADVLYNLAVSYRYKHDYSQAITAALRAAQIHGAKSPGSDRQRTALTMVAFCANESGDFARALTVTETILGFTKPAENPQTPAWAQFERARALIGLRRGAEARPLLVSARAAYAGLTMTQRVQQIDDLLAHLR
jgi:tetratricopeptide (TPR) repeat protein/predicted Ser/Thr protein kinase